MKYTPLPLERELAALPDGERVARRNALALELFRQPGFQMVTDLLRTYEQEALDRLRRGSGDRDMTQRALGRLQTIEAIRQSLAALLPADQQANVDWYDAATEEWTGPIEPAGREV